MSVVREAFLSFFKAKSHLEVQNHFLLPKNDPTLLFINAGMAPMKSYFTGLVTPPAKRVVTCQPCLRVGGKHNDLEEVGQSTRHHTLFEMLGNFSFGGYGRDEAIEMAWEFLVDRMKLSPSSLYVTVHPRDHSSKKGWEKLGLEGSRILEVEENLWSGGDVGPRGYCTEIFYDFGKGLPGVPPDKGDTGQRYLEVWNLVFMTEYLHRDGRVTPLPLPCIDTGMGLERMEALVAGSHDSYQSPSLKPLLELAGEGGRVVADHARAVLFLVAEGIAPGPTGHSYVLRRIMRRAIAHQIKLGKPDLLKKLAVKAIEVMSGYYKHLTSVGSLVSTLIDAETDKFQAGWKAGSALLREALAACGTHLPGKIAFTLYDTHGLPLEAIEEACREKGVTVGQAEFERELEQQRSRSRWQGEGLPEGLETFTKTEFVGYDLSFTLSRVLGLFSPSGPVESLEGEGWVVLDSSPFYAESGGQSPDWGFIGGARVTDVQKSQGVWIHKVENAQLKCGQKVSCKIDRSRRARLRIHHSLAHLLVAAVKKSCRATICSCVLDSKKVRVDFKHEEPLNCDFHARVERITGDWIVEDLPCTISVMNFKDAVDAGADRIPGKQYPNRVRVVTFGNEGEEVDRQLCGGTHVKSSAELGGVQITEFKGKGAEIKRLVACAGPALVEELLADKRELEEAASRLGSRREDVNKRIARLLTSHKGEIKWQTCEGIGKRLVYGVADLPPQECVKQLNEMMAKAKASVGLFYSTLSRSLTCRTSGDCDAKILAFEAAGSDRGGGGKNFAQVGQVEQKRVEEWLSLWK